MNPSESFSRHGRLGSIELLVLDVDGVLTDGRLYYGAAGEDLKVFHVRDGVGIRAVQALGVRVAVITGRGNDSLRTRMNDLGIDTVVEHCSSKGDALRELMARLAVRADQVLCVGDDLPDLDMLPLVGTFVAVNDAVLAVRSRAAWITSASGGRGAVREICDEIVLARRDTSSRFRVVIPARYASTRFPGKPLITLAGKTMIHHTYDRAVASGATEVVVATDDPRIAAEVRGFAGDVQMTAENHTTGTSRVAEVAKRRKWDPQDIVVNLQGDEPAMPPRYVAAVARELDAQPKAELATLATAVQSHAELEDPNVVKVIRDCVGLAIYFSRGAIPYPRPRPGAVGSFTGSAAIAEYLRHLGIYAYRVQSLVSLATAPRTAIEQIEDLEQLRALYLGLRIAVGVVDNAPPHGVDTESDVGPTTSALANYSDPSASRT